MFKWKVLQKAVEAKDYKYLAPIRFQELLKEGWSDNDIARFANQVVGKNRNDKSTRGHSSTVVHHVRHRREVFRRLQRISLDADMISQV